MTDTEARPIVVEPGVYDMPDDVYHGDPVPGGSLSSSGAKLLLPPSCPARFRWEQDNGRPPNGDFDYGHAAHLKVLGTGAELVVIDAKDWRTNAAKEAKAQAYQEGKVPILASHAVQVDAMAEALAQHPIASKLLDGDTGRAEQSLFWWDNGIARRARIDFLRQVEGVRTVAVDYKTTADASLRAVEKSIGGFGYHQQAAWYLDGIKALELADDAAFLFIFQEKTAPYLVTVVEVDATALRAGRELNRRAMEIYTSCKESDTWPAYSERIELVSLPKWLLYNYNEDGVLT